MKKYICLFITLFFVMISNANAAYLSNANIKMVIHEDGSASVTNTMTIIKQKDTNFEYDLMNVKNSTVSNITLSDDMNTHYEQVDSIDNNKYYFYKYVDQGYKKFIKFSLYPRTGTYTLKYDISNVIFEFSDGTLALDWFIYTRITGENCNIVTFDVSFDDESILEKLDVKYAAGIKKISKTENDNSYSVSGGVDAGNNFRILLSFKSGVTFENTVKKNKTFTEYYDDVVNGRDFVVLFNSYTSRGFLIGFALVIEIGVVALLLSYIIIRYGTHDEYYGMEIANKKKIQKAREIPFYESVPCQGDTYKIFFVAGYFRLLKSKSGLIGAILFKMYLNDNIEFINGKNGYDIRFKNDLKIDRSLDQDLYNIMMEISDMRVVSASKANRFAKKHYLRIMTWFNMGYSETITDEINRGHATRGGKVGKSTKIIFSEDFVDYGNKIIGMKKYLLNFNQVPRKTPLSEDTYKILLMCAEMLGIGKQVSEEILRKNPNNIYARKLQVFQNVKPIYKDIYGNALIEYRKTVKDNEIYNYDSMKDDSMQSTTNVIAYKSEK